MKKTKVLLWKSDQIKLLNYLPAISFVLIALILFITNAFPALYGDEYASLLESHNLLGNLHAIGYFSQLFYGALFPKLIGS